MRGASAIATYLGRLLVVVGFTMIVLAWNGAAGLDYIQGQFPFLLSGTMPGLALIIVGTGLEYVQNLRQFTAKRAKQMAELNVAVVHLVSTLREHGGITPAPEDEQVPVPVGAGGPAMGAEDASGTAFAPQAAGSAQAGRPAAAPTDERVIAGRSSFHRPDCHLVSDRDDLPTVTRLEADAQSLAPCKVCKP